MKALTRWFLDNPVAANLLMAFILVAGYLSFKNLRIESFPQIPASQLIISVVYPGGTPKQVDEGITQRIEDAISGVPGIKSIMSQSSIGYAEVTVKKKTGVKLDRLMEDIRNEIEAIVGFPAQAERPQIYRDEFGNLAAFVLVYGGDDPHLLQKVSSRVQNALKKHPEISKVTNLGKRKAELVIEPNQALMQRYNLHIEDLATRIDQWSFNYRSGELKTARGNITLRGDSYSDNLLKLQNLPIIVTPESNVTLKDIATIKRSFEQTDSIVRFEGKQAIALMVSTSQKDNLLRVSEAIDNTLQELQPTLPVGIHATVMADMAPYIEEQLSLLGTNGWQGLLIVILLLGLFLEVKLALWVALGIPVSLAGTVWLMGLPALDYSINDITLFGMILVLGILVDDAIVVGESIHQARQKYRNPKEAAWHGVNSVAIATMFGALTTIAAFSPMLWIENELAKVLAGFSAVVIFALTFSLIESKFILPSHLCLPMHSEQKTKPWYTQILHTARKLCMAGLDWFSLRVYQPVLKLALHNKGSALTLFVVIMLLAYGALMKGHIRSVFFPEIPGRYATLKVTMAQDAALSLTQSHIPRLEAAIVKTSKQLQQEYGLDSEPVQRYLISMENGKVIELTAELTKTALSDIPGDRFLQVWRENTGQIEGSYAENFTLAEEPAGGTAITVSAESRDLARFVAQQLKEDLRSLPGVNDVFDDSQDGKRQLQVKLNERGVQLGIDQRQLAILVGGAFGEIEVHRLLDKGQEVSVKVRLPEQEKRSIEQLKSTPVYLGKDSYVSLGEISDLTYSRQPEVLYRRNRNEVVSIYWKQNRSVASPEEVWEQVKSQLLPELKEKYPQVQIEAVGEFAEILEVQAGFQKAMLMTILLIYVLLAIPLKSYWQPLIIMSVIPFGFAGAIYGHGVMGLSVSLLSMFGMMAMTGVVINDSLVLMTRFNQLYRSGMEVKDALIEAGKSRMRAIFLTTVTTVCGLLPLLTETSEQAQYLKPAAVSLVFGELLATPITLILIPVLLGLGRYKRKESNNIDNSQLLTEEFESS
ncbi:efflux RND transporter permease subunit [Paraneptunicella aestuarii]|uniref:efflux RND transporter permease subunit n=1 Tax=Paraneptunicella aestuarii TaxID=2831148 RepID=UPI001E2AB2D6|nr:efflux RND transporter permease subunit [Paraneptunicella aestuarii]UAA38647.1 efflux RND transporter permease subunit [Paraneptunicella aestuarii]